MKSNDKKVSGEQTAKPMTYTDNGRTNKQPADARKANMDANKKKM